MDDDLDIERIGGFGGFGLDNSRLRSRGTASFERLTDADKDAVRALFAGKSVPKDSMMRDGFTYRITWRMPNESRTIEVPESLVPSSLVSSVRDTLE